MLNLSEVGGVIYPGSLYHFGLSPYYSVERACFKWGFGRRVCVKFYSRGDYMNSH